MIWQSADKSDVLTCYMMSVQISIHNVIDIASYSYVYTCESRLEVIYYLTYVLGLILEQHYESEAQITVECNFESV